MTTADGPASASNDRYISLHERLSARANCSICTTVTKTGQATLRCLHSGDTIHVTCQHKLFRDAGYEPLINKIDWLSDFIYFSSLAYRCKACTEKHDAVPQQSIPMTTNLVAQDLNTVKQSIATLDTKIQSLSKTIAQLGSISHVESNSDDHRPQPPSSYASVVSVNMVKSAVSEVFREQHKVDTARLSVAIYGFPEKRKDAEQLFEMFDYLSCKCDVTRHSRIGRPSNGNSKSIRHIKVDFKSVSDTSSILSRAIRL